jgi:acyl-CoA synthetase (AMP-forming)/AMP-acid ligase II
MNIAQWLAATALERPTSPALLTGTDVESDYAGFANTAATVAAHLTHDYGVGPGHRVGIYLENSTRYLECLFGIWWAGAVAVPINHKLHGLEVATIVEDADPTAVFSTPAESEPLTAAGIRAPIVPVPDRDWSGVTAPVSDAPAAREMGDCAWIFYSSGTTGRPKGVMLSNANLIAMSLCHLADVDAIGRDEAALYAAPMSHGAGLYGLIHVRMGSRHVVPVSGRFEPDEVLTLAKATRNVSIFAAPTMVRRLVDTARARGEDGDGLKTVIYGGGPMYLADIQDAISVMGQRFVQIYGQAESPMTITALSRARHEDVGHVQRLSSVGTVQSAVSIRIAGPDGQPVPPGITGDVEVKGATVMLGYWRNPAATADAIRDGWLRTGDLGHLDESGFLTLAGRSKDVIISGGTNIYPREVEDALVAHPDVREAAVIGIPDREWGEVVVAFVVPHGGAHLDPDDLDTHCLRSIARFKRPRRYHVVAELPKNNYGKVPKTELRAVARRLDTAPKTA